MKKQQFISILDRYLKNQATAEEHNLLHAYYHLFMADDDVLLLLKDEEKEKLKLQIKVGINARIGDIQADVAVEPLRRVRLWPRIAVAAAAVAAITLGVWFYTSRQSRLDVGNPGSAKYATDVAPGKNGATITLASGKVIQLSDKKSGVVVGEGDLKYNDGSDVRYSSGTSSSGSLKGSQNSSGPVGVHSLTPNSMMLTASTARGQTYQFTLPDGTKVWLNADSKISFPSQFSGEERKILLDGEGYFEVAHNKKLPFRVESKGQTVEVLGTHFNINAYKDEIVTTTTLLEGSVRVAAFNSATGRENIMLKPNQQSILNSNGAQVLNVDVNAVVGWKNGLFTYKNTQLSIVMRQIERWYNVSVHYDNNNESLKERLLSGSVSRYDNVSGILRAIELTGAVKFKVKDKTITVYQQ